MGIPTPLLSSNRVYVLTGLFSNIFSEVTDVSVFSDIDDAIFDFYLDFDLGEEVYQVHCRVAARLDDLNFPEYVPCDTLTCVSVRVVGGEHITVEDWKDMLMESDSTAKFWKVVIDKYVLMQMSLLLVEPGHA